MNIHHIRGGVARPKTLKRPLPDDELDRLVDSYVFKPETPELERAKLREEPTYQRLKRIAKDFYRLGEKGAKPTPKIVTPVEAQPEIIVP